MRRLIGINLLVLLIAATTMALPSAPRHHFDDRVGLVSADESRVLDSTLREFEARTGIQFVITVLPEIDGEISDHVNRLYESWGIGSRADDRGLLAAIFPGQGQSRLETGYGLEGDLPDAIADRILRGMLEIPRDQSAQRFAYIMMQVAQRVAPDDPLAAGEFSGGAINRQQPRNRSKWLGNLIWLVIIFALMGGGRAGRSRWLGPLILMSAMSGGRSRGGFGGGGFGGGGFSGGGGMSGGGGASGGW